MTPSQAAAKKASQAALSLTHIVEAGNQVISRADKPDCSDALAGTCTILVGQTFLRPAQLMLETLRLGIPLSLGVWHTLSGCWLCWYCRQVGQDSCDLTCIDDLRDCEGIGISVSLCALVAPLHHKST